MKNFFADKRVLFMYVFVIGILVSGIVWAFYSRTFAFTTKTSILKIDEEAYGENEIDTTELDFSPILDSQVTTSDKVIKIDFVVGGSEDNTASDIIYDIALNDLEVDCDLLSPFIKWKLIKNDGEEVWEGSLDYQFDTIKQGRLVLTDIQQDLAMYSANKERYDSYQFYLWFSDSCQSDLEDCVSSGEMIDQSNLLGKKIKGVIEVELYTGTKKELVRNPLEELDTSSCSS